MKQIRKEDLIGDMKDNKYGIMKSEIEDKKLGPIMFATEANIVEFGISKIADEIEDLDTWARYVEDYFIVLVRTFANTNNIYFKYSLHIIQYQPFIYGVYKWYAKTRRFDDDTKTSLNMFLHKIFLYPEMTGVRPEYYKLAKIVCGDMFYILSGMHKTVPDMITICAITGSRSSLNIRERAIAIHESIVRSDYELTSQEITDIITRLIRRLPFSEVFRAFMFVKPDKRRYSDMLDVYKELYDQVSICLLDILEQALSAEDLFLCIYEFILEQRKLKCYYRLDLNDVNGAIYKRIAYANKILMDEWREDPEKMDAGLFFYEDI